MDEFISRFATWPRGFYPGAEALVRALRRRHRVFEGLEEVRAVLRERRLS